MKTLRGMNTSEPDVAARCAVCGSGVDKKVVVLLRLQLEALRWPPSVPELPITSRCLSAPVVAHKLRRGLIGILKHPSTTPENRPVVPKER